MSDNKEKLKFFLQKFHHDKESRALKKEQWLESLDTLFSQIKEWLKEFTDKNMLKVGEKNLYIEEEELGKYKVRGLIISLEDKHIMIHPVARNVVGGNGRVDIISSHRTWYLFLRNDPLSDSSHWVIDRDEGLSGEKLLTEETFSELLLLLLN